MKLTIEIDSTARLEELDERLRIVLPDCLDETHLSRFAVGPMRVECDPDLAIENDRFHSADVTIRRLGLDRRYAKAYWLYDFGDVRWFRLRQISEAVSSYGSPVVFEVEPSKGP